MTSDNKSTTHPPGTQPTWDYDAFLSYSTKSDYRLAIELEEFLEGFHEERGIRDHGFQALKICTDGSDFSLPRRRTSTSCSQGAELEGVREVIRPYLARSAALLILWPGQDQAGAFSDWELAEFLEQNRSNRWDRPVRLAVTRGDEPASVPRAFFSDIQREAGLHQEIFYDFRGRHKEAPTWKKVREFERERMRLAVDLVDPLDETGRPKSVDAFYPGWKREKDKRAARTRNLSMAAAALFAAIAIVAVWQYLAADAARAEATRRGYISLSRALAAEAPRLQGQEKLDDIAALMARQAFLFNRRNGGEALAEVDAALRSVLETANFSVLYENIGGAHNAISWSDTGWTMISGSPSRTASWWKWNQGDVAPSLLPLPQFEDAVFGVAVSGDGQTAVYSTERHGLRQVNRASISTETQVLSTNRGLVRSLAMDTKGEWLGIGGNDGEFRLIDLKRPSASVRGFMGEASVTAVAVSGERGVAAWGNTQGAIRVTTLSNATTNEWHAKDFASLGSNVLVAALALSRDGRLAVSGWTQQRFSLPDPHQPHQKGEVVSMEIHPLLILDLRNGEIVQNLGPLDSWSDCVAFSPTGRYLAVGTISGDVRIWDTTKRNAGGRVIKGHKGSVNAVAWDDQEHWIASMDIFRNFRVSMIERPNESPSASFAGPVLAVAVDQKDMSVLCVSTAGRLNKWDPSTSQMVPLEASAWDTKAAAISRDGRYFALAAGHANPGQGVQVRVRTNDGFQPLAIPDSPAWVESLAFGRSGTLVFGCENEIRYWRPEIAHTKRLGKVEGWVRCLAISEDGLRLVSSSDDGIVRLWRIVEDEPVFDRVIATESSRIRALAINSNYDIAVGFESGQVRFFASDGGQRLELSDHRGAATALAFLGNNAALASGGEDGTVRIYRLYTGHAPIVLRAESGGVNALAWREKDKCLVAGYSSGRVIAWITDTTKLAEVVCQLVRRDLTATEWRRYVARDVPYERTCQAEKPMDATASPQ